MRSIFPFFLSISIFLSANVTYILIHITDTTTSPSFYYLNKRMIIFDCFIFSKLTVTLTRPWYAHSPEIYVPLKLYSTVQDSSMTTSLHDDEEEGSWNRDEIIGLRFIQPESREYFVCFSFDFLLYQKCDKLVIFDRKLIKAVKNLNPGFYLEISPSSSRCMYPFLPSFPSTSRYTEDRLSWFLSSIFPFLFLFLLFFSFPFFSEFSFLSFFLDEEDVSYNNPKPLHLILVDFCGLCSLSIPSRWIDLDKPVTCKVTFRDYTVPVVSMHLLLIRTEYIHDVSTISLHAFITNTYIHDVNIISLHAFITNIYGIYT